jgi:hypothetical protein
VHEGTPEERKIEVTMVPELVLQHMTEKNAKETADFAHQERNWTPPSLSDSQDGKFLPTEVTVHMTKLEILENDAMDTLSRMTLALPHVVTAVSTLNIRSTRGLDFNFTAEELFIQLLPQFILLKTLVFSVGDVFNDPTILPTLYKTFPPGLSALRFRGPVSLARSDKWEEWVGSFESPDFLPDLRRLSFVLDLDYEPRPDGILEGSNELVKPSDEMLREAHTACKRIWAVAEARGIVVQPFRDAWAGKTGLFQQVDERWADL